MGTWLGIFLGGGIGSMLRGLISGKLESHWGIMAINIVGAFLIGLLGCLFLSQTNLKPEWKAFIVTGFLGGFTTFSTFMLDFENLLSGQKNLEALAYLVATIVLGILAIYGGVFIGKKCF